MANHWIFGDIHSYSSRKHMKFKFYGPTYKRLSQTTNNQKNAHQQPLIARSWMEWSSLWIPMMVLLRFGVIESHFCCWFTILETVCTWKWMVGILISFWDAAYFQGRADSFRECNMAVNSRLERWLFVVLFVSPVFFCRNKKTWGPAKHEVVFVDDGILFHFFFWNENHHPGQSMAGWILVRMSKESYCWWKKSQATTWDVKKTCM